MYLLGLFIAVSGGSRLVEVLMKHLPNTPPLIAIGHNGHIEIPSGP